MAEPPNGYRRWGMEMATAGASASPSSPPSQGVAAAAPFSSSPPEGVPSPSPGVIVPPASWPGSPGLPSPTVGVLFPAAATLSPTPVTFPPSLLPVDAAVVTINQGGASTRGVLESLAASPAHMTMLKEYQKNEKVARRRMLKKEKELFGAQSEIYQLLGLFSLFQGVIFSALAQSSILTCEDWWCPFFLALGVLCGTLMALNQRLEVLALVRKEVDDAKAEAEALYGLVADLKRQGDRFCLRWEPKRESPVPVLYANAVTKFLFERVFTYDRAVFATVMLLSLIILRACYRILCHGCACKTP